ALVRPRSQWSSLYGFVRPSTGNTFWLLLPTVSVEAFQIALSTFAAAVGAGPTKQVLFGRGSGRLACEHPAPPSGWAASALFACLFTRVTACRTPLALDQ